MSSQQRCQPLPPPAVSQAIFRIAPLVSSRSRRTPLQMGVGLATGLAVVGDLIGSGAAREEAVVGETPNLAARLQALAEPDAVVIAETARGGGAQRQP